MLVQVAQAVAEMAQGRGEELPSFDALPEEKQAWVLALVRNVLVRFADPWR
ncbi:MAG: hypothetical protein QME94_09520 [Anaerolineae bacterium]|nr:hypothetical protein [Anaerolineae bacterium]